MKRKFNFFALLAAISLLFASVAIESAMAGEAGLVTYIKGDVYYTTNGGKKLKAVSFMKANDGHLFHLDNSSVVRIVYFKNGRKEKWDGVVEFTVSKEKGNISGSYDNWPKVTSTGDSAEGLREIPTFIKDINTERTGGVGVRSINGKEFKSMGGLSDTEQKRVKEALLIYDELLNFSEPDEITPELYMIGILSKFQVYEESLKYVEIALKKQPENAGILEMKSKLLEAKE
ncbi:tetratricopeptide repeat protein [Thermodesulfobacteriota bacterium]